MTKAKKLLKQFAADEQGTALMEYTILLGGFVVAVIVVMTTLGGWISQQWTKTCTLVKAGTC